MLMRFLGDCSGQASGREGRFVSKVLIKIMDSNRELVSIGFEHPVVWSALDSSSGTVLEEEARAQRHYVQLWLNHVQVIWGAWKARLVSRSEWEAYRRDMLEGFRVKALQERWKELAEFYPVDFRKLVGEVVSESKATGNRE